MVKRSNGGYRTALGLSFLAALVLAGCAQAPQVTRASEINDPHEVENRAVHDFNKAFDRNVVRPIAGGGSSSPALRPVRRGLTNLGDTLETPGRIVNNLLQGRVENAGHNAFRLALNLTVGLGGLFDPATSIGLGVRDTDFGETLHSWGTGEGAYLEVPLLGPSTERDLIGDLVDAAINPLSHILPADATGPARVARIGAKLADRSALGPALDDVLDNSADSYAQTRLIYLQNRRFELARNAEVAGQGQSTKAFADPYEDPFGEALTPDPYSSGGDESYVDPYEELFGP